MLQCILIGLDFLTQFLYTIVVFYRLGDGIVIKEQDNCQKCHDYQHRDRQILLTPINQLLHSLQRYELFWNSGFIRYESIGKMSNFALMNENMVKDIKIADYNYDLPDERIARHPLQQRDACKLLTRYPDGKIQQHIFSELPDLIPGNAMLVYNNTRVINARLKFQKNGNGSTIEIFCLEPIDPWEHQENFAARKQCSWLCFVGNSKRWKDGALSRAVTIDGKDVNLHATRTGREGNASKIMFSWDDDNVTFSEIIEAAGEIPIPPYLNRGTEKSDETDYQTIYSHIDGSVAAPTAGLHFTPEVFAALDKKGVKRRELTLHVGAGTFQPVKSECVGDHEMHQEFIRVNRSLIKEIAESENTPVIAVGTTSVRTLESLYHAGCLLAIGEWRGIIPQWFPYDEKHPHLSVNDAFNHILRYMDSNNEEDFIADTQLLIAPGYTYRVVSGIVTNFHQPQSTLLLLVSAFVEGDWKKMYDFALDNGFRFLSYGDASLLIGQRMQQA